MVSDSTSYSSATQGHAPPRLLHGNRHPSDLGHEAVVAFLTHLATELTVAASMQNQAQSALLFLYREVVACELPLLDGVARAKAAVRLPVVLTRDEVALLLASLRGTHRLFGELLYGSGLRIMEGVRLRVKAASTSSEGYRAPSSHRSARWLRRRLAARRAGAQVQVGRASGAGSTCSLRIAGRSTRGPAAYVAIT